MASEVYHEKKKKNPTPVYVLGFNLMPQLIYY